MPIQPTPPTPPPCPMCCLMMCMNWWGWHVKWGCTMLSVKATYDHAFHQNGATMTSPQLPTQLANFLTSDGVEAWAMTQASHWSGCRPKPWPAAGSSVHWLFGPAAG